MLKPIKALYDMVLIRRVEETLIKLSKDGKIPGTIHTCIGQEGVAVGVCSAIRDNDVVFSSHRGHGHAIGKGISPKDLIFELAGREDGLCKGLGGSQHLASVEKGFYTNGITGGMTPLAVGMALGFKKNKEDRRTVVFLGDGAMAQGIVYESMNLASLWNAPVLFVCENNEYSMSAHVSNVIAGSITDRALACGIETTSVNGNMPIEVNVIIDEWRAGQPKPYFIECYTYRISGHSKNDAEKYRTKDEVNKARERDPIQQLIRDYNIPDEQVREINIKIDTDINEIIKCL